MVSVDMKTAAEIKDKVQASLWQAESPADSKHSPEYVEGRHYSYVWNRTRYWGFGSQADLKLFLDTHPQAKLRVEQLKIL